MSEYLFLAPIVLAFILGVMSPGPSFLVIAQTAMANSREKALFMALGMGLGAMIFALLAASGVYVLLKSAPWMFMSLKIIGGLYLCFLAYKIIRASQNMPERVEVNTLDVPKKESFFKAFLLGLFTQLSNPKTAIVIAGIFAAFFPADVPAFTYAIVCLMAFVIDTSWYALVALVLSTKKAQATYGKYQNIISMSAGGLIGLIGLKLALSV